jgi:dTDP-4-amino-4,6-dideoxygalactose transaminase
LAIDIKYGDEIIIPSHSASGTATAVVAVGAKPIFVDINPDSFLIDIIDLQKKITKKTKVIIPVHLYGQSCSINKILQIANKNKIKVIEDCAQAHGTKFKNIHVGNFGVTGCFSFYPTKNLGAIGDGGCVITNNKVIFEKIKILRDFGWKKRFDSSIKGLNSRLDEIQAAILRIKLRRLNQYNLRRKKIASKYFKNFLKHKYIKTPKLLKYSNHTFHQFVIKVPKKTRNKLIDFCKKKKIFLGIHYPIPLHSQKAFNKVKKNLENVEKISKEIISLPIFPYLTERNQNKIVKEIKEFFK